MRERTKYSTVVAIVASVIACQGASDAPSRVVGRTLGDTGSIVVIDTLWEPDGGYESVDGIAVGPDGSIAVADGPSARLFLIDASGTYGRQVARSGGGPGEVRKVSALQFLDDGRLLVRDLVLSRLNVYEPDGTYRNEFPIPPSELTGQSALRVVEGKYPMVGVIGPPRGPAEQRSVSFESVAGFGMSAEDVRMPYDIAEQCPVVYMQGSPKVRVGYAPEPVFAMLPSGSTVIGCAETQRLELRSNGAALRRLDVGSASVERTANERQDLKAAFERLMSREGYSWRWEGPDIPKAHAVFSRVYAGEDGSVWVRTPRPSVRCGGEERCAWKAKHGFTVFDETGGLVGVFDVAADLEWGVDPVFTRSVVVAVVEAGDGRHVVVRLALR